MSKTLHIVGAGVAGLACAVATVEAGHSVRLYEATKRAGGRCRSFFDSTMEMTLDNGSHVVLGGNPFVAKYRSAIGAKESLVPVSKDGGVPFVDLANDNRWSIRPNAGAIPWWLLSARRRPPQTSIMDFLRALVLLRGDGVTSVANAIGEHSGAWTPFWQPISLAIMNTDPKDASAVLFGDALKYSFFAGGGGLVPFVPKDTLAETFIRPAEEYLSQAGCPIAFQSPLVGIEGESAVKVLRFRAHTVSLEEKDSVVLALPPWSPPVRPYLQKPLSPSPIVNVHFAANDKADLPENRMVGLINGVGHWIFRRPDVLSVTVSADGNLARMDHQAIASLLWQNILTAYQWPNRAVPAHRVIVERRATPLQDSFFYQHRPATRTAHENLFLAGDWINTGLPCTLEGAIKSGFQASQAATGAGRA